MECGFAIVQISAWDGHVSGSQERSNLKNLAKLHQEMVKSLRRGDTVITSGGLVGKVTKVVDEDQVEIEIADGVRVRQVKSMVADVLDTPPVAGFFAAGELGPVGGRNFLHGFTATVAVFPE